MTPSKPRPERPPRAVAKHKQKQRHAAKPGKELVIVTGISGAGKASALKDFEDLGFHAVDNLPLELAAGFCPLWCGNPPRLKAPRSWWMCARAD
jgi:UPF0042 nucleotide-binding protein